jgi:PAS domain S-box-containing protein
MDKSRSRASGAPPSRDRGPPSLDDATARSILTSVPAIIYVYDVEKRAVVFLNRRLGEYLGYEKPSRAEAGTEWRDLIHPEDAERFAEYGERLRNVRQSEVVAWEYRLRHSSGEWRWFASHDVLLESNPDGTARLVVGSASDVTQQKLAQEHKDILLGEMQHRTRNLTAVIDAIARQSLPKDEPAVEQYYKTFIARLRTLFSAAEIVMSSQERVADLQKILDVAIAPFRDQATEGRIRLSGPPVSMAEEAAASLALAVHELATNAIKYGALSRRGGTVALNWQVRTKNGAPRLEVAWKERGGPQVKSPAHEGFGARVIRYAAARQKDGKVRLDYAPEGVSCEIGFSLPA